LLFFEAIILLCGERNGKRVIEKARRALPFTPGFLEMAADISPTTKLIKTVSLYPLSK
jgi:hypothetical protein